MRRMSIGLGITVGLLVACSNSSNFGNDAGPDAGDAGPASGDAGSDAGPDAGPDAGMLGINCSALVNCDQTCSTDACTNGCYASATGVAQGYFNLFVNCIADNCPSTDGGPCESGSSSECSNCNQSAGTGACVMELVGCEGDMFVGPPDPDGGGVVVPDAGQVLSCGGYIACVAACATQDGGGCASACSLAATPEAAVLAQALNTCLAMACPSTDGGPCETSGPACSGCVEQVELAQPDTCAAPYIACNSDTSNTPDGGSGPRSLVDGGVISTLVIGVDQVASTIVVSGGYLYFTQVLTGTPVLRVALTDGGPTLLDGGLVSSLGPPQPTPVSLAVDANNVYVWSVGTFALNSSINNRDGTVVQIPIDGGAAITLRQNMEVLYDDAYLNAIAVDSQNVYWVEGASGSDGAVMRAPIGGGSAVVLYSGQEVPQAITTDGTNVYWADWGPFNAMGDPAGAGSIWAGSIDGGTPKLLASNQGAPETIAVDLQNVYWANLGQLGGDLPSPNGGSVMEVPIDGGTVVTIASQQAVPVSLLAAGGAVYWSEYGLSEPG